MARGGWRKWGPHGGGGVGCPLGVNVALVILDALQWLPGEGREKDVALTSQQVF